MAIPLKNIVQINPGVLTASGSALDLNGLILTDSEYAPTGAVLSFTSPDDVALYFGSSSVESAMASIYFQGYKNASRTPGEVLFSRYNSTAIAAFLRSGSLASLTLAELKLLSGVLTLTIDATSVTTANITLTSATSFNSAADTIENAINAVSSAAQVTVSWDTTTKSFIITSSSTGLASTLTFATGTLSTGLKLTSATGAVLSQGADAAVVNDLFTAIKAKGDNWAGFSTTFYPDATEALAFSSWVSAQSDRYFYVMIDNSGEALNNGSTDCLAYQVINASYANVVPVYGQLSHAASVLGYAASLNFDQLNGRRSLAFRVLDGLMADVSSNADYAALIANGYNFYGTYAANNISTEQWYPGSITGDYKWLDAFVGQVWLNANLQSDVITLFQSETYLPYGTAGRSAIEVCMTSTIEQFKSWGGITPGITLDDSQIQAIKNATGSDPTNVLNAKGYLVYIGEFTAQMRAARTSPIAYLWYDDGGFIQKLTLNSIAVQ